MAPSKAKGLLAEYFQGQGPHEAAACSSHTRPGKCYRCQLNLQDKSDTNIYGVAKRAKVVDANAEATDGAPTSHSAPDSDPVNSAEGCDEATIPNEVDASDQGELRSLSEPQE
jgi:hypothetical protein